METNKFYDIHFHTMDISHANITAFMKRMVSIKVICNFIWELLKNLPGTLLNWILSRFKKEQKSKMSIIKAFNLLSFMESSIQYDFLVVDHFLKNKNAIVSKNNEFSINEITYNKIVLCPLIMDFGYKNIISDKIFYNIPPQKPITDQITDLFKAIHNYYNKEIEVIEDNGNTKLNITPSDVNKSKKLFEIYPFMGLNSIHYSCNEIKAMLAKYFRDFQGKDTVKERKEKLYKAMGEFDGDLDNRPQCKNIFVGIKLYPPLGFEPWPENEAEKGKVKLLYNTCTKKNIPITAHCSTGGFKTAKKSKEYTNPAGQWVKVLKEYPNLKINFAHFGSGDKKWQQSIIEHILKKESRVYTDFSCNTENDTYYKKLEKIIRSRESTVLRDRILFGSDFMINLLWLESYNQYIKYFQLTRHLDNDLKFKFANTNSEMFLFG